MARFAGLVVAVSLLVAPLPGTAGNPVTARLSEIAFFTEISALVADGALDAAEARLTRVFLDRPEAPLDDRIAWLKRLADVQTRAGKHTDAADSFWNAAQLVARRSGPKSPELARFYGDAGRAYLAAGEHRRAVRALRAALEIDAAYLACDSPALADLYAALAAAERGAANAEGSREAARLARDASARCTAIGKTRSAADLVTGTTGEGRFALVEIAYATDRATTGEREPEGVFAAARGALSYGFAKVSIPLTHKAGSIESPSLLRMEWEANPARHIVLMSVDPAPGGPVFGRIGERLAASPDGLFLFVHGYNTTFGDAAKRTAQIAYDLNFGGVPFLYSWPSQGQAGAYLADAATVELSARNLLEVLERILANARGRPVHLVAHSMGNRALTVALEMLALKTGGAQRPFAQIVFAAPDVDSELFARQVATIAPLAERLTLYTSDADLALSTSRKLHGGKPRAGESGADIVLERGLETIDMSDLRSDLLSHSYFASSAEALTDILWLFSRNAPPMERCGMQEKSGARGRYWIYLSERCDGGVLISALTLAKEFGRQALSRVNALIDSQTDDVTRSELGDVRAALAGILRQ